MKLFFKIKIEVIFIQKLNENNLYYILLSILSYSVDQLEKSREVTWVRDDKKKPTD